MGKLKHNSFTLNEMIIVIVLIAILAVIAIPKYLDLSNEAEISAADGVFGSIQSAIEVAYAEHLIKKTPMPTKIIDGYLAANQLNGWTGTGLEITRDYNGDGDADFTIIVDINSLPPDISKDW